MGLPEPYWSDGERTIYHGDCLAVLPTLEAESISAVVTDPPYGWGFMMNRSPSGWDNALPKPECYRELLRVLKPGGFLLNFCGPRLDGLWRMGQMIEEAGFDIGYSPILWVYATGFPKGTDVSKQADRAAGAEREVVGRKSNERYHGSFDAKSRPYQGSTNHNEEDIRAITAPATPLAAQWDGWKTGHQALKPACEVIVVAQKPMEKGAQWRNVVKHGVGGFNVKGAAVPTGGQLREFSPTVKRVGGILNKTGDLRDPWATTAGRYPSNLAVSGDALGPELSRYWSIDRWAAEHVTECEDGLVAYCPKASRGEKNEGCEDLPEHEVQRHQGAPILPSSPRWKQPSGKHLERNLHSTVKPVSLVAWLLTLVMSPEGICLDPFLGSGTTLVAAKQLGLRAIGIELNDTEAEPYCRIARKRVEAARAPEPNLFNQEPT